MPKAPGSVWTPWFPFQEHGHGGGTVTGTLLHGQALAQIGVSGGTAAVAVGARVDGARKGRPAGVGLRRLLLAAVRRLHRLRHVRRRRAVVLDVAEHLLGQAAREPVVVVLPYRAVLVEGVGEVAVLRGLADLGAVQAHHALRGELLLRARAQQLHLGGAAPVVAVRQLEDRLLCGFHRLELHRHDVGGRVAAPVLQMQVHDVVGVRLAWR